MAARVLARVRRDLGVEVTLARFLSAPCLGEFAALVAECRAESGTTTVEEATPEASWHPVNANQAARLMRVRRAREEGITGWWSMTHLITAGYRIEGPVDRVRLTRAVEAVVRRHSAFRTAFSWAEERQQVVEAAELTLRQARSDEVSQALEDLSAPLPLDKGVLGRFLLIEHEPERHEFWLAVEHIIADRSSIRVVLGEIGEYYRAGMLGVEPLVDPHPPTQNHEVGYIEDAFCTSAAGQAAKEHWNRVVGGKSPWMGLVYEGSREPAAEERQHSVRHRSVLDAGVAAALTQRANRDGLAWLTVTVAALARAVAERTAASSVPIMVPVGNRDRQGLDGTVSFLSTMMPLSVPVVVDRPSPETLAAVRELLLQSLTHASYPAHRLTREFAEEEWGHTQRRPLLYLDVDVASGCDLVMHGCEVEEIPEGDGPVLWGIAVWVRIKGPTVSFEVAHPQGFLPEAESARLAAALIEALHDLATTGGDEDDR